MPSIAWFPLAIVLFKLTTQPCFFVVVLGAAPSIANGLLEWCRTTSRRSCCARGRVLGPKAGGIAVRVVPLRCDVRRLPQAGLVVRMGSLLAGELLVIIPA